MLCKGCQRNTNYTTRLTWPDGTHRGEFCIECRDWISKGHRSVPVVMVDSDKEETDDLSLATRYYRNDTTGEGWKLVRCVWPTRRYFMVYGPHASAPAPIRGAAHWGHDFSWTQAERAFFKLLQKEANDER